MAGQSRSRFSLSLAVMLSLTALAAGEETFNFRTKYLRQHDPENTRILCRKVTQAPKLDGTLNDPLWGAAGKTESAFMMIPQKEVCGRQTVVYLCYDDETLYAAFDCEETELDQQQIDNKDISRGDHVSLRIEVGDYRGRGQIFVLAGNRSGCRAWGDKPADYWARFGNSFKYKCAAGPNRWFAQFAVPFKGLGRTPLPGVAWGAKLVRYGKATETGALRLRSSWPYIPAPSENTVLYNGRLFFDTDNVMANGGLAVSWGKITGFEVASGKPEIAGESGTAFQAVSTGRMPVPHLNWSAPEEVTLVQKLQLRAGGRFCVEWSNPAAWSGMVAVCGADGKLLAEKPLSDRFRRLDFELPAGSGASAARLKLKGTGDGPAFRMSFVLDDVPLDWICLTNNDWIPERNLKNRLPQAAEGAYTYLKSPL